MHEFWLWCGFKSLKILVKILKNNCENLCKRFEFKKGLKRKEKNKTTNLSHLPASPAHLLPPPAQLPLLAQLSRAGPPPLPPSLSH
jgi:hypothetical protein